MRMFFAFVALSLVAACSPSPNQPAPGDTADTADTASVDVGAPDGDVAISDATSDGEVSVTPDAVADASADPGPAPDASTPPVTFCPPLPAASGPVLNASPGDDLATLLSEAAPGSTVLLADGTYDVSAAPLWISAAGISVRSASGDRDGVVLDGKYVANGSGEVIGIRADNVTVADLTIIRARYHPIHVTGGITGPTTGTVIYNVVLRDPGEQAIKINTNGDSDPSDNGLVACSEITMSAAGRLQVQSQTSSGSTCYTGGVDAHAARDWVVRDNLISGFWCDTDLSEHAVHFWRGSRGTIVERNLLLNNARGVGFGLALGGGRTYPDGPCGGVGERDHYGGVVRNNMIIANDAALFASPIGMDGGIAFAYACEATAVHNTVASLEAPFASIEWRFAETTAVIANNLTTGVLRERQGATALLEGNLSEVPTDWFVGVAQLDAHLKLPAGAAAVDAGVAGYDTLVADDFDGEARGGAPCVGADEVP